VVEVLTTTQTRRFGCLYPANGRLMLMVPEGGASIVAHSCLNMSLKECKTTEPKILPPQFLTMQLVGTEKTFRKLNMLYVQRNLDSLARKIRNASCLRNGTLLVEVFNEKQLDSSGWDCSP